MLPTSNQISDHGNSYDNNLGKFLLLLHQVYLVGTQWNKNPGDGGVELAGNY